MSELRHFLDIDKFDGGTLRDILDRGHSLKKSWTGGRRERPSEGARGRGEAVDREMPDV